MPYISKKSRRYIFSFLGALLITSILNIISLGNYMFYNITSLMYMGISISWIITVQRRVPLSFIKGYLVMGGMAVTILFLLRLMKWDYFESVLTANRLIWYSYYIPVTIMPLLSLLLAIRVGDETNSRKKKYDFALILGWLVLVIFIMTNDLHNMVFKIESYNEIKQEYSYGIGIAVVISWCALLTILSLAVLVRKSRDMTAKYLSWIPVGICFFFSIFLFIYILNGGNSPSINGRKLYNFQEIFGIMYLGLWEASLRIGLIPSNSDYDDIFRLANVKAAIADDDYNLRYMSNDAIPLERNQIKAAVNHDGLKLDENRKLKVLKLQTGNVLWIEDHTMVNELNTSLKEAIDRISEENSLLEIENEVLAQKQTIDVRNMLYNSISEKIKGQLDKLEYILEKAEIQGDNTFDALKQCIVLGAYIKRQANLLILSAQYKYLKLEELRFAIRESLENIRHLGIEASVSGINADSEFEGSLLIFAYEVFEATIEAALPKVETISCILLGENGLQLEVLMDTPSSLPDYKPFDTSIFQTEIDVLHEEEGIYVRLTHKKREVRQ